MTIEEKDVPKDVLDKINGEIKRILDKYGSKESDHKRDYYHDKMDYDRDLGLHETYMIELWVDGASADQAEDMSIEAWDNRNAYRNPRIYIDFYAIEGETPA